MVQWLMPPGFLSRYWEKQQKTLKWQQKDDKHPDGLKVLPQFGTARNCSCFYPWCVPFGFESSLHHFRVIANFHSVGLEDPICWVGPCPFESPGQRTSPFSTRMDFPWCFLTGLGSGGKNSNVGRIWKKGIICNQIKNQDLFSVTPVIWYHLSVSSQLQPRGLQKYSCQSVDSSSSLRPTLILGVGACQAPSAACSFEL